MRSNATRSTVPVPGTTDPVVTTSLPDVDDPFDGEVSVADANDTLPCGVSDGDPVRSPDGASSAVPALLSMSTAGALDRLRHDSPPHRDMSR